MMTNHLSASSQLRFSLRIASFQTLHWLVILSLILPNIPVVEAASALQDAEPTPTSTITETPTESPTESPTTIPTETLPESPVASPTTTESPTPTATPIATQSVSLTPIADQPTEAAAWQSSSVMFVENVGQFDSKARFQMNGTSGTIFLAPDAIWVTILDPKDLAPAANPFDTPTPSPEPAVTTLPATSLPTDTAIPVSTETVAPTLDVSVTATETLNPIVTSEPTATPLVPNSLTELQIGDVTTTSLPTSTPTPANIVHGVNMRFSFSGGNSNSTAEGFNRLETKVSYFIGNDSSKWQSEVPVWGGVRYVDVYPGVDLEVTSEGGRWAWRFVLKQGAIDPPEITMKVAGADTLDTANGRINLTTNAGDFSLPILEMVNSDGSSPLPTNSSNIKVVMEAVPLTATPSETLTIKESMTPTETASPTATATSTETPANTATPTPSETETATPTPTETVTPTLDPGPTPTETSLATPVQSYTSQYRVAYSIRGVGVLAAPALRPLASGASDMLYSTYLGGGSDDYGNAIAVDSSGAAYVTGSTISSNFPTIPGSFNTAISAVDAYIVKLNSTGSSLIYATFLGGSGSDGGYSIALDSSGAAYITGRVTSGSSFPTTPGAFSNSMGGVEDAFVTKLNSSGTVLIYSTFLGGAGVDDGYGIAVDSTGAAYIIGQTNSSNFPVTVGAYDISYNGGPFNGYGDVFVAKLNASGSVLSYATFLGGSDNENAGDIAIDSGGAAYVTGYTPSSDFPTISGSFDVSFSGGTFDAFVTKLNSSGSNLVYSTFLGGAADDRGYDIAVDPGGVAYVTGRAGLGFPTTSGAFDTTINGDDGFIVKLNASGSTLAYGTFVGGSNYDDSRAIAIGFGGVANITGRTYSSDFPTTSGAFDTTFNPNGSESDAFVFKLQTADSTLAYSTFLGGSNSDESYDIATNGSGAAFVMGHTYSTDYPTTSGAFDTTFNGGTIDAFVSKLKTGNISLPASQAFATNECPFCNNANKVDIRGQGINSFSGNYNYQQTDGQIEGLGATLSFERSYNSLASGTNSAYLTYNDVLGYGWTHNYNLRLIFNPPNETGVVMVIAPRGSQMRFIDNGNGTYTPYPAVLAQMTRSGTAGNYTYLVTTNRQYKYTFDNSGKLTQVTDPENHLLSLNYTSGRLTQIISGSRSFTLTYNASNQIATVKDSSTPQRTATYTYTSVNLTNVTNMHGVTYTYSYQSPNGTRLLTQVNDPVKMLIKTDFDTSGRATKQYHNLGNPPVLKRLVELNYAPPDSSQRLVLYDGPDSTPSTTTTVTTTVTFDDGVPVAVDRPGTSDSQTAYVSQGINPGSITDPNNNTTTLQWSTDGGNLTQVKDALTNTTNISYDSLNNLTSVTDPLTHTSAYTYTGTLLNAMTLNYQNGVYDPLKPNEDLTTSYTYTDGVGEPVGLVETETSPLGIVTRYTYYAQGQVLTRTLNYKDGNPGPGPDEDLKTTYTYDSKDRVDTVTDPASRVTKYTYDATHGWLTKVTRNYVDGIFSSTQPDTDLITQYDYYNDGTLKKTTDPLSRVTWTCYDGAGRVIKTIQNPTPADPCPTYTPSTSPDLDRITITKYDNNGRVIATTDPSSIVTRTYYDDLSRPKTVIQNLWPSAQADIDNPDPTGHPYDPANPDRNTHTDTFYDNAGNVQKTVDNAGQVMYYCYDALNRAIKTVQNPSVTNPCTTYTPSTNPDQDVTEQTVYDNAGNMIATIDPAGIITRTYYDELNRPYSVVRNLVGQAITVTTPPTFSATYPDRNIRTDTVYDKDGRAIKQIDTTTSRTDWSCYDGAGRVTRQVLNATTDPCVVGYTRPGGSQPDQNIITDFTYDNAGRQIAVTAPDGKITRTYYDLADRRTAVTSDLVGQAITVTTPPAYNSANPDQNVTTQYVYDALSRVVKTTTASGATEAKVEYNCYDSLSRVVKHIQNPIPANPCTTYTPSANADKDVIWVTTYDAAGDAIAATDPAGTVTRTYYDKLHRVYHVVQNLQPNTTADINNPDPLSHSYLPLPNRNVHQQTNYDAAGRPFETVDNANMVTHTNYDLLGRSTSLVTDYGTGRLNLTTQTVYDKVGNAVQQVDANSIVTSYEYDGLYRLKAVVGNYLPGLAANPEINVRTEYRYDSRGNRLAIKDARSIQSGLNYETLFTYDKLDRVLTEKDPLNNTTTHTYDLVGLQASVLDAKGQTTNYQYDGLRRLKLIDYPDATTGDTTFNYNAVNRISMTDGTGVQTNWNYDGLYRMVSAGPTGQLLSYTYNKLGSPTMLYYPDTKYVDYSYSPLQELTYVSPRFGTGAASWGIGSGNTTYNYTSFGALGSENTPFGEAGDLNKGYNYDTAHRLTFAGPFAYTLDAVGNRTKGIETLSQPQPIPAPDFIVADGFESGDMSGWSTNVPGGTDLSVTTGAALVGSYGLQALINDTTSIYVEDTTPASESRYRARFYFDPNSVTMASGDTHTILYGTNAAGTGVFITELNFNTGAYRLRMGAYADDGTTQYSSWVTIGDAPHLIELEWWAATTAGANDGGLNAWVDGNQQAGRSGVDNDTQRLEKVRLGAAGGLDAGTSGTEYFDAYEAHRQTYIGAPSAALDFIFADGFESADLSAWRDIVDDSGDLSATTNATLNGGFGMQAVIDDTTSIYVTEYNAANAARYRARFYFDPNSVTMADGDTHDILDGYTNAGTTIIVVQFRRSTGSYQLRPGIKNDAGTYTYGSWTTIVDAPHAIEIDWQAATAAGANNGLLAWWLDGTQQTAVTAIDNDTHRVDYVKLGAAASIDAGTSGTEYFDAFESHSQTYIGPAVTTPDTIFSDGFNSGGISAWGYSAGSPDVSASTAAALAPAGGYGMQIVINDTTGTYVRDSSPANAARYRARFYFDPNSIVMANGNSHTILQGSPASDYTFEVLFSYVTGVGYQLKVQARKDDNTWVTSATAVTIADSQHFIEVDWAAATAAGANDGSLNWWIDGVSQTALTGVDNDTKRVDFARLGAVTGVDTGTTGTEYFDAFESRKSSYIGPFTTLPDQLFSDGFESGGYSAWAGSNGSPDFAVTTSAALGGGYGVHYGLQVTINDTTTTYVRDASPANENHYRARFYFHPNSLTMANGDSHAILQGSPSTDYAFEVLLGYATGSGYQLQIQARKDDNTWVVSSASTITNATHFVEVEWTAATAAGANNGSFKLWIDGTLQQTLSGVDNDTKRIENVRLGAAGGIDATTSGTYYFDGFESRRSSYIGSTPVASTTVTTITYQYDPLNRLKRADYVSVNPALNGNYFAYAYDAVGNRLTETVCRGVAPCVPAVTTYTYDNANRLTAVNAITQTWDNNGNLTQDYTGATYTYDAANRLRSATVGGSTSTYTYNGLGDRVSQTAAGVTTNYTLDLISDLTQVLSDGTNSYLYGVGRVGEKQGSGNFYYHLDDALGSVRQLSNGLLLTLSQSYDPFGNPLTSVGSGGSVFGFAGEQRDLGNLVYLRARYLSTATGRFITADMWAGAVNRPLSLNKWNYVEDNPVNRIDPSGLCPNCYVFFFAGAGNQGDLIDSNGDNILDAPDPDTGPDELDNNLGGGERALVEALRGKGITVKTIYPYGKGIRGAGGDLLCTSGLDCNGNIVHVVQPSAIDASMVPYYKAEEVLGAIIRYGAPICVSESEVEVKDNEVNVTFIGYSGGGQMAYSTAQKLVGHLFVDNLVLFGAPFRAYGGLTNIGRLWDLRGEGDTTIIGKGAESFAGWDIYNMGFRPRIGYNGDFVLKHYQQYDIYQHGAIRCSLKGSNYVHVGAGDYFDDDGINYRYQGMSCSNGISTGASTTRINTPSHLDANIRFLLDVVGVGREP